jgi:hypothetical protein
MYKFLVGEKNEVNYVNNLNSDDPLLNGRSAEKQNRKSKLF